jgi:hypothetical protein
LKKILAGQEFYGKYMMDDLEKGVMDYIAHLQINYDSQGYKCGGRQFIFEKGHKYIHVIMQDNQRSSHSWILMKDDKSFKRGDILKSATWRGPARNFARGNVLCGGFKHIQWTGA